MLTHVYGSKRLFNLFKILSIAVANITSAEFTPRKVSKLKNCKYIELKNFVIGKHSTNCHYGSKTYSKN